ncbi:AmmeMemoRadiSam system radical SAM enzyme [Candidatus Woesearchaeota archaeon]|nr:AmmeMemoRadiSam system radical SAM enzyme [Candidatus Woesearchaeota archaeon]
MKEAMYYKKLKDKTVKCLICPRNCVIENGERGFCKSRENKKGKLFSLVYAAPCSVNVDPIEKKPLFHFLPGTKAFSIGTTGCNLRCKFCQNWQISQAMPEDIPFIELSPEKVVEEAIDNGCKSIAYTYTEPAVFFEYVLDIAKFARKKGIKNIIVSNGFVNQEPLKELCKYIDAANIDLKSFSDEFYKRITKGWLKPVLESLKTIKKQGVWLEVTNMIIPKLNDDMDMIKRMCLWIKEQLGEETPLHFSRFHPDYLLRDSPPTEKNVLLKAVEIAREEGLKYVYIGNILTEDGEKTKCAKCGKVVVDRGMFSLVENKLKDGKCGCGEEIEGVWE